MGWSSGIDKMAQSSNEISFFSVQLQRESDMECRGIDLQISSLTNKWKGERKIAATDHNSKMAM